MFPSNIQSSIQLSWRDPSNLDLPKELILIYLVKDSNIAIIEHDFNSKIMSREAYLELFEQLVPLYDIKENIQSRYELSLVFRKFGRHGFNYTWSNATPNLFSEGEVTQDETLTFDYALRIIQNLLLSTFESSLRSKHKCELNPRV
jgi:hypothetical protein